MANDFYNVSGAPVSGSSGSSAVMRGEFASIAAAFDKLPTLTANTAVVVNSAGTKLISTASTFALGGNFSTGGTFSTSGTFAASGNISFGGAFTTVTACSFSGALNTTGSYGTTFAQQATTTLTLPNASDTLVGRASTDTLTNKTLTAPVIATIVNTGTLTLPTSTDTLVGTATTDTLTNKSISGSANTLTNIANSALTNSSLTIGSTSVSLGATAATIAGLTLTSPTINGGTHTAITSLGIRSTSAAFDLTLATAEVLTAGRTLSLVVGDTARTLTLTGSPSLSGATITGTGTLATTTGKTATFSNTLTFAGTDSTTMTFPGTSATLARTDAANTFTGHQTIEGVTSTGATGTGKFVFDTSPTLSSPVVGTQTTGDNSTKGASTAFVQTAVSQFSGRNRLMNGNFVINQRGYVAGATLAAGSYGHDRWKAGASGGDYSFIQVASDTTITIASGKSLIQIIEDKNIEGGSYTVSWTGTSQARIGISGAAPSGAYASSPIAVTGASAGQTISVEFDAGTLNRAQLEIGSSASSFERVDYATMLVRCWRYFQSHTWDGLVTVMNAETTSSAFGAISFPYMRAAPSITLPAIGTSTGQALATNASGSAPGTLGTFSTAHIYNEGFTIFVTGAVSFDAKAPSELTAKTAVLNLDAEL